MLALSLVMVAWVSPPAGAHDAESRSSGNWIERNLVEGHDIGLQAYGGAADVVVTGNTILDSSEIGMALEAPRSMVQDGEIRSTPRGISVRAASSVSGVRIADVEEGVVVAETGIADISHLDVTARQQAVRWEDHSLVDIRDSTMSPPILEEQAPLPDNNAWLPFVGVGAVLTAFLLEFVRWRRERHDARTATPVKVWKRA